MTATGHILDIVCQQIKGLKYFCSDIQIPSIDFANILLLFFLFLFYLQLTKNRNTGSIQNISKFYVTGDPKINIFTFNTTDA